MNLAHMIGNLTRDPEYRDNGSTKICTFTIAVNRDFKNKDGVREADYFRIKTFNERADVCHKYLTKGVKVCVVGPIRTGSYTAQDGTKHATFDIFADKVEFLTSKSDRGNASDTVESTISEPPIGEAYTDDELPF